MAHALPAVFAGGALLFARVRGLLMEAHSGECAELCNWRWCGLRNAGGRCVHGRERDASLGLWYVGREFQRLN